MAVGIRESTLCASTNVRKNKRADSLASQAFEVAAIPGWDGGGEDARLGAEVYFLLLGSNVIFVSAAGLALRGVVTDAEAVAIVRAAVVQTEAGVVALCEDAVGGRGDEVGEQDRRMPRVDEEATHGYVECRSPEYCPGAGWPVVGSEEFCARQGVCFFRSGVTSARGH